MARPWDQYRCDNKHYPSYLQVAGSQCRRLGHECAKPTSGPWNAVSTALPEAEEVLADGIYCEDCLAIAVEQRSTPVAEPDDRARWLFRRFVDERPSPHRASDLPAMRSLLSQLPGLVSHEHVEAVPRVSVALPDVLKGPLFDALRARYKDGLYPHQVKALEASRLGHDVVQVTPTASGKTIGLLYPAVDAALAGRKAIVVAPRKVLAGQYLSELGAACDLIQEVAPGLHQLSFGSLTVTIGCFDGNTPKASRDRIRRDADIVITNEYMVKDHLCNAAKGRFDTWRPFMSQVDIVVMDELDCHSGNSRTKLEPVLRLLVEAVAYASEKRPQILAASATISDPSAWHNRVTGGSSPLSIIQASSGQSERDIYVVSPMAGQSDLDLASEILVGLTSTNDGLAPMSLVFANSPGEVAKAHGVIAAALAASGLESEVSKIRQYIGRTTLDERRDTEHSIMKRQTRVTVANEALGVGADLSTLEVAIFVGSPLTAGKAKQYLGRVGRRRPSIVVFVADDSPFGDRLRTGCSPLEVIDVIAQKAAVHQVAEHWDAHCLRPLFGCLGQIPGPLVKSLPKELREELTGRLGLYRDTGQTLEPLNESPSNVSLFDDEDRYVAVGPVGEVHLGVADGRRSNVIGAELVIGEHWYRVVQASRSKRGRGPRMLKVERIQEPSGWYATARYETDDLTSVKESEVHGIKVEFGCGRVDLKFRVTNPSGPRISPPTVFFPDAAVVRFSAQADSLPASLCTELRAVAFDLAIPHLDFHLEVLDDGSVLMFDKHAMGRVTWIVAEQFLIQLGERSRNRKAA